MSDKYIEHWIYLDSNDPENESIELSDFILSKLEVGSFDEGIIEEIKLQLKQIRYSYSKFLRIQFDKGLITLSELLDILGIDYEESDESFEIKEY